MSINDKFDYQNFSIKDREDIIDKQEIINNILNSVTRIEVIWTTREFSRYAIKSVDVHLQDWNKTLKIFIT